MAGKKHGFGLYNWIDGSRYSGEWYENKIKGFFLKKAESYSFDKL